MSFSGLHRLKSYWHWLLVAGCCALACMAHAQTNIKQPELAPWEIVSLESLPNQPLDSTVESVSSKPEGAFKPLASNIFEGSQWQKRHWLRIKLKAKPELIQKAQDIEEHTHMHSDVDSRVMVLSIDKPNLDDIRLYTPLAASDSNLALGWAIQKGGDTLARRDWDMVLEGSLPHFLLPTELDFLEILMHQTSSTIELYMSVESTKPVQTQLIFETLKQAQSKEFHLLFIYGLTFGAVLLVTLFTAITWRLHADALYGWYSAYTLMSVMSAMCHSGLAHMLIWPIGGQWSNLVVLFFIIFAGICLSYFCATMLIRAHINNWVMPTAHGLLMVGLLLLSLFLIDILNPAFTYYLFLAYILSLGVFCIGCASIVARAGHTLGYAWLSAAIPLLIIILLTAAEGIGLTPEIPYMHVYTILAFTLEATVLGLALQWLARKSHAATVEARTLASTDPLTGFLSPGAYTDAFRKAWKESKISGSDLAFFYIRILRSHGNANSDLTDEMLLRTVRIVRAATRSQDVVGRLDHRHLCVFMPNMELTEDLSQRLSRMVALGLMPDTSDPQAMQLYFRIVASSRRAFVGPRLQVDEALRQELDNVGGSARRPIRTLDRREKASDFVLVGDDLEALWNKALQMQVKAAPK